MHPLGRDAVPQALTAYGMRLGALAIPVHPPTFISAVQLGQEEQLLKVISGRNRMCPRWIPVVFLAAHTVARESCVDECLVNPLA